MHALLNRISVGMAVVIGFLTGLWLSTAQADAIREIGPVALVIGNDDYADNYLDLRQSVNGATSISALLRRLGFTVTQLDNADHANMRQGLRAFMHDAIDSRLSLVFYSGHATGVDGRNFLLPVDAHLVDWPLDVEFEAVSLDLVLRAVSRSRLGLVILDANCPNPVEPQGKTVVACGGKVALEGPGDNTPYTKALLRYLEEPGLEIGLLFHKVRDEVLALTEERQEPTVYYGSLPRGEEIYLARMLPRRLMPADTVPVTDSREAERQGGKRGEVVVPRSLISADTNPVTDSREAELLGMQRIVPEHIRNHEGFDASESAGLFVGIRNFEDLQLAEVPYAVDDAVDLAYLFAVELALMMPERVTLALAGDPKKPESNDRLQALLKAGAERHPATQADIYEQLRTSRQTTGERGVLVVAAATHGFTHEAEDYLVGADSRSEFIKRTGIKVAEVFDEVTKARAPRRLVLIDACREELSRERAGMGGTDPESAMGKAFAKAIAEARGQVVLTGTTLGGYSYDDMDRGNGVFTGAIVDGLRGEAPADKNGFITTQTLANYVNDRVLQWVRDNRPAHVKKSQGITQQYEGSMARLPLATNPDAERKRQEEALRKLADNLGGPITGGLYEIVKGALDGSLPPDLRAKLLDEIEALDGNERLKRSLVHFVDEHRGDLVTSQPSPDPSPPRPALQR